MSKGICCKCPESKKPVQERAWSIVDYKCNHSAFNGWHRTPSDYSAIVCDKCGNRWRTKSAYVEQLKHQK